MLISILSQSIPWLVAIQIHSVTLCSTLLIPEQDCIEYTIECMTDEGIEQGHFCLNDYMDQSIGDNYEN